MQRLLAPAFAQVVEQRQQHDGHVAMAALQALEVIGHLHHAAHQRGIGLVTMGDAVVDQRGDQLLHLADNHGGAVELDHTQRAVDLVQVRGAGVHDVGVARVLDVRLEGLACLGQGVVELGLDPVQRSEIGMVLKSHCINPAA